MVTSSDPQCPTVPAPRSRDSGTLDSDAGQRLGHLPGHLPAKPHDAAISGGTSAGTPLGHPLEMAVPDAGDGGTRGIAAEPAFDYGAIDESNREAVQDAAGRIRLRMSRTAEDIVEIGRDLIAVKKAVGHGNFLKWIDAEFGMAEQSARNFMNVADRFKSTTVGDLPPTVLYALAAPSTPDEVRDEVARRTKAGEKVTTADVKRLKVDLEEIAASPDGRKAIKVIAKKVRAEDQATRFAEREAHAEEIAERNPELPAGRKFPLVLIDWPRKFITYSDVTGSEKAPRYPVMDFDQQCDFALNAFAAPDCICMSWSTAASLVDDLEILAEHGFVSMRPRGPDGRILRDEVGKRLPPAGGGSYGSHQIWRKVRVGNQTGTGRWVFDQHEVLLIARRGDVPAPVPGTQPQSVIEADVTDHSTKPGELVRAWIDRCWPHLTKVEIFARGAAPPGWVFWGNQMSNAPEEVAAYSPGDRVTHPKFGTGIVTDIDGNKLTINFNKVGSKRMLDSFVEPTPASERSP